MHKGLILLLLISPNFLFGQAPETVFEKTEGRQTPAYPELIQWWKKMDASAGIVSMKEMGMTDAGYPLHLVLVSADKDFDPVSLRRKKKTIILINNGIHPGEPDGIDASMLLVKELTAKNGKTKLPVNVVLAII